MLSITLGLVFGFILSFVHYYADWLGQKFTRYKEALLSLTAGISLTYIFLELLPESFKAEAHLHKLLFVFLLGGIVVFHIGDGDLRLSDCLDLGG